MRSRVKEIFKGADGEKISSKRVIGIIDFCILVYLWMDDHFTERNLNMPAFEVMATLGTLLLVGGVVENFANRRGTTRRRRTSHDSPDIEEEYL